MSYQGIEAFHPNGNKLIGWCFVYSHNGRIQRSIATYYSRNEAKLAGKAFCNTK